MICTAVIRRRLTIVAVWTCLLSASSSAQMGNPDAPATYQVLIWLATDQSPEAASVCGSRFSAALLRQLDRAVAGSWSVTIEPAPVAALDAASAVTELSHEQLLALRPDLAQLGKLSVLSVIWNGAAFELQADEYDLRVRKWNASPRTSVIRADDVMDQAVVALVSAFSPVGTIGRPRDGVVEVRLHAGAYSAGEDSLLVPRPGALMEVVIRRRRRAADGGDYSFSTVPWTVLQVTGSELGVARCEIHSGLRSPLRVRGVSATNRLAIEIRPKYAHTVLRLHVRGKEDDPLTGYQVYARQPGGETSQYIGQTDWQGEVVLPRSTDLPLQTYYIKHGSLVLARLPIVAGHHPELSIGIVNDEQRLRAEGALKGVQDRLIDAVARREIHAARIRRQLDAPNLTEENIEQAQQLLTSLRELPGRNDFVRKMQVLERAFVGGDATTQNRIDRLFRDTRDIMTRNIDPDLEKSLAAQIADAERRLKSLRDYQAGQGRPAASDASAAGTPVPQQDE